MENKTKILTVSEVANQIEEVISDYLSPVYVEGEVSNYYRSGAGHIYLSLKDNNSLINAIIWNYVADKVSFKITNGMRVIIYGEVVTYKLRSQYQIKVMSIRASGLGNLYLAFEQLKNKLEMEGLFDSIRKKIIPKYPAKIGVVTSATSAAVRDIIQVSGRRNPYVQLIVFPAVVQGEKAAGTIINGIEFFNQQEEKVDLIIISRGGGSIEDLWAFNEESVVRSIYNSKLPIVTGIGHEIDFTLSDFAADYRAPTPSAAAEESIPDIRETIEKLNLLQQSLINSISNKYDSFRQKIKHLKRQVSLLNPANKIQNQIQHIDNLERRLKFLFHTKLIQNRNRVDSLHVTLNTLNPESILKRGYSIVFDEKNKIIKSVENIQEQDKLKIKLSDGFLESSVDSILRNYSKSGEENE